MMLVLLNDDIFSGGLGWLDLNHSELESIDKLWELLRNGEIVGVILEPTLKKICSNLQNRQVQESKEIMESIQAVIKDVIPVDVAIKEKASSFNFVNDYVALKLACAKLMNLDAIVVQNPEDFPYNTQVDVFSAEKLLRVIELEKLFSVSSQIKSNQPSAINNLSDWFEDLFNSTWQSVKEVFVFKDPIAFACRGVKTNYENSSIEKCKLIDLGTNFDQQTIALVITVTPKTDKEFEIILRVYPISTEIILPEGLKMSILDESENVVIEVISRKADNWIQCKLLGESGDSFSVQVTLDNVSITEHFVI